jgi:hypothetical protein
MPLHRLTQIVMGVPNVEQTAGYYAEFGLLPTTGGESNERTFATVDGGEQLRIVPSGRRRLVRLGIGADDPDDLDRVAAALAAIDVAAERTDISITAVDPGTEVAVRVEIAARYAQQPVPGPTYNAPGVDARIGQRAPGILRDQPVRPRKLGHVVLGSTDKEFSQKFFQNGIGFKVSDTVPGIAAFMRCSTGTPGDWAGISSAPTSSGTSKIRPAASPSTTPTWTASLTTPSGSRESGKEPGRCGPGGPRRPRRSCSPRTSAH